MRKFRVKGNEVRVGVETPICRRWIAKKTPQHCQIPPNMCLWWTKVVIRVKSYAAHTKTTPCSKTRPLSPHTTHACAHAPLMAQLQMRHRYRARTLFAEVHAGIGKILTGIGVVLTVLAVIAVGIPRNDVAVWIFQLWQ